MAALPPNWVSRITAPHASHRVRFGQSTEPATERRVDALGHNVGKKNLHTFLRWRAHGCFDERWVAVTGAGYRPGFGRSVLVQRGYRRVQLDSPCGCWYGEGGWGYPPDPH
jgi:hypothetical protein